MPRVEPFEAVQFHGGRGDMSSVVAPPYDVLDADDKAALVARDEHNVVSIDLPHVPPKELGPPKAYAHAAKLLDTWLADGTLSQRSQPAMFAYRQTFDFMGSRHHRCGMFAAVETAELGPRPGGGILPHEETFSGPKEDRLALMRATRHQLSPIFGLHADQSGEGTRVVRGVMEARQPDATARTADGVLHELWTVEDAGVIKAYQRALEGEDIFIADGHHRYNTAVNYLKELSESGEVPSDHSARRCMMVIVGMSDPGMVIGPTHRVLGGMAGYSWDAFARAAADHMKIEELGGDPHAIEPALEGRGTAIGLLDFATGRTFIATPKNVDPLADSFGDKSKAWRTLDVTFVQEVLVERVCKPALNNGQPVKWAFPHTIDEVLEIGSGAETGAGGGSGFAQIAAILRPTPLDAVRDICLAGELMPQKSTFFYPKVYTGLVLRSLEPQA
ncbi:MAG: DUF1015 domain-containing protein [Salinibacterium sp.]|nr:DUF1015 domain-containing protein [Salinibacterium sp.]